MKLTSYRLLLFVMGSSLILSACNQSDKKDEPATTDTATVKSDTPQPPPQETTPDAIKAAPDLYKVLADSAGIRVLEATYKPGDSSAMHSHNDYVVYTESGGDATFYGKDGVKMSAKMNTGTVNIKGAEVHSVKNTGKTTIKVLLVETTRPMKPATTDASMDATKVAPNQYKVLKDSLGFRVLSINYKPGESSAMHSHPDAVMYVLSDGMAEFTMKDGTKVPSGVKKGMAAIGPADTHAVKNTGKVPIKLILVEVNRAAN